MELSQLKEQRLHIYVGFEGHWLLSKGISVGGPRNLQSTTISLDSSQPHSGSKDLRVEFSGNCESGQ